jgi:UDP-N-acetylglucosamine--N-acetylmuramyl-(pentapeptide) pyrophosphoryl-undecaprenol N-acetylglucosamine transferase
MTGARLVALAAGGTGGHMFPAESAAGELKRRGWRVLLITDARGARYAERFPTDERIEISAASPSVGGPIAKAVAAAALARGLMTAIGAFRRHRPAAAIGFGGYPSFPAMKAAGLLRIPYGLHEQNGVLGRTNRLLAGGAAFLAHGFPNLERAPAHARLVEVGNPLRPAVADAADVPYEPPAGEAEVRLLIFGGSQGATIFAEAPPSALAAMPQAIRRRLRVVHQAREADLERVRAAYAAAGISAEVAPFFNDMPARIAASHIVLARAGASTVCEISAIGRPSILVPLAIAMDDHQSGNARALADVGAAQLIAERDFNSQSLSAALVPLLVAPERLAAMAAATRGRIRSGAAVALADLVEEIAAPSRREAA